MVTDTAPFRYPHYHTAEDTPDKIDYERTARLSVSSCLRPFLPRTVVLELSSLYRYGYREGRVNGRYRD